MLRLIVLFFVCLPASAQDAIRVLERREVPTSAALPAEALRLRVGVGLLDGAGWTEEEAVGALQKAAGIIAQCGVALESVALARVSAPVPFLDFLTPLSRRLSAAVPLARPAIWFVRDTRQRPAFDAEAIGRGNSRTRPELADTVWVTRSTRDLGIAVAHELVHVLMDSGEHSEEPGNLMQEATSPASTRLTGEQCRRIAETGIRNGLLTQSR
ncbi:MAG: hypothetical protein ACT4P9_13645 [Betaproteobacteria bacterium]